MSTYSILKTRLGDLLLVANRSDLTGIYFNDCSHAPSDRTQWIRDETHPVLKRAAKQLREFLEGKRSAFSLPTNSSGTDFQKRIWREIAKIPFGKTISYSELAKRAGSPTAIRAAGTATGRNPLSILVPCHRVLGNDNGIGGYAGGVQRKRQLLEMEKTVMRSVCQGTPLSHATLFS